MHKIALINPGSKLNNDAARGEPLQLGYLAAYLRQRGVEVIIIDEPTGGNLKEELEAFNPGFVGVTAATSVVNDAYRILSYCRRKGFKTVIGGVHASTMPDEATKYADYVVVGEGEEALFSLIDKDLPTGTLKYPHIKNIDELPHPDRSLMNMEFYLKQKNNIPVNVHYFLPDKTRLATIITSRGCPYECIFCHNNWRGLPARYHSADYVFNEIMDIKTKYDNGALYFQDDDFFINKKRLLDICKKLCDSRLNIIWAASARVSSIDKEVLEAAYQAGCRQINFGIETGSQKVLDTLNKRTTVKLGEEAIKMARKAGLLVYASFMIGNPGETVEDMKMTKRFIMRNRLDSFYVSITAPYPGTALWEWCKTRKLIPESFSWDQFSWTDCGVPANEFLTRKQIELMRLNIFFGSMLRMNLGFIWFNLRYLFRNPSYFISRFLKYIKQFF